MKVDARSPQFQAKLDIFRLSGERANSIMDRKTHTATDDLYFPEADTFIVRLTCDGYGGSGEFAMRRDTLAAKPYTMGAAQTMVLDGANFGLYEVQLEAGKRYQLTTDQPDKGLRADLLDEDGQFLDEPGHAFRRRGRPVLRADPLGPAPTVAARGAGDAEVQVRAARAAEDRG